MDISAVEAGHDLTTRVAGYVRRLHSKLRGNDAYVLAARRESQSILHYLLMPFPQAMGEAHIVLSHFDDRHSDAPWGLRYAVDALLNAAPDLSVEIADEFVMSAATADEATKSRAGYAVRPFISAIVERLSLAAGGIEAATLRARTPFIRALAAQALVDSA